MQCSSCNRMQRVKGEVAERGRGKINTTIASRFYFDSLEERERFE